MLKKTITYTDYNDVKRTEEHFFNLSKAEILEMQMTTTGGFTEHIQKIVDAKDTPSLFRLFKELIFKAYGKKSEDGRRFIKSEELSIEFSQTEAYTQLYMELATDDVAGAEFVNSIIPSDMKLSDKELEKYKNQHIETTAELSK